MLRRFNEQVQLCLVPMIQLVRRVEAVAFSGSVVQIVGDMIALSLCDGAHAHAFGQVLPEQSVEVLVAASLP